MYFSPHFNPLGNNHAMNTDLHTTISVTIASRINAERMFSVHDRDKRWVNTNIAASITQNKTVAILMNKKLIVKWHKAFSTSIELNIKS
jgi:hypothetical protein